MYYCRTDAKHDEKDDGTLLMTQDIIDAGRERMKAFEAKVVQRITEADKANDRRSIWVCVLSSYESLCSVPAESSRSTTNICYQADRCAIFEWIHAAAYTQRTSRDTQTSAIASLHDDEANENLILQTIERLLTDMLGKGAPVQIMGNAPIGHYEYGFSKNELATVREERRPFEN